MKKLLSMILAVCAPVSTLRAEPLQPGAPAPPATAINQDGEPVDLGNLYEDGLVLVYFYPKADTPGCTAQACSLRDSYENLRDRGVTVVGVSTDNPEKQRQFRDKYRLPFMLLADTDHKVAEAFGVPVRLSFASRQAFLIKDGVVVWRDLSASTEKQAADVIAALDALNESSAG